MSAQAARARYLADQVSTATPAALIVLLYDRLERDIEVAATAQAEGRTADAVPALVHAQQIVAELASSLDASAWAGAGDLAALYGYLLTGLITARTKSDAEALRGYGVLVASLGSAWRAASVQLVGARFAEADGRSMSPVARVG